MKTGPTARRHGAPTSRPGGGNAAGLPITEALSNPAYRLGKAQFDWWPDWHGECVAIVGGGPSLNPNEVALLRDRIHVIAIKAAVDLCPWAEAVYGCDAPWWNYVKGLPKYPGLKFFHGVQANQWAGLHRVEIDLSVDAMLIDKPLKVGNGGNSGFQAINLAIQFGASDIILLGFDMGAPDQHKLHWYGRNKWEGANNPMGSNFKRWQQGFDLAKKSIKALGVEIVNCSPQTRLNTFRTAPLGETLEAWGL
jgi:hypothetical protein